MPTDAEQHYLEAIADDCRWILGPGIELDAVECTDGPAGDVRLRVRYRLATQVAESVAEGETVVDAHAQLRQQLVVDRIRIGFTSFVESDR